MDNANPRTALSTIFVLVSGVRNACQAGGADCCSPYQDGGLDTAKRHSTLSTAKRLKNNSKSVFCIAGLAFRIVL